LTFSHPDFTVGSGISPDLPLAQDTSSSRARLRQPYRRSRIGGQWPPHSAPKVRDFSTLWMIAQSQTMSSVCPAQSRSRSQFSVATPKTS